MSYDPRKKHRSRHDPSFRSKATKALRLAHRTGVSLKRAWQIVKSGKGHLDPRRKLVRKGPRGGLYFKGPHVKRYDSMRRRSHHRRRHDPISGGRGMFGKIVSSILTTLGGNVGGVAGKYMAGALPGNVSLGGKTLNIPTELASVAVAYGAESVHGKAEDFLDGFAGGLAAAADPAQSQSTSGALLAMSYAGGGSLGI